MLECARLGKVGFIVDNGVKVYPVNPPWVNPGGARKKRWGIHRRHPFCLALCLEMSAVRMPSRSFKRRIRTINQAEQYALEGTFPQATLGDAAAPIEAL